MSVAQLWAVYEEMRDSPGSENALARIVGMGIPGVDVVSDAIQGQALGLYLWVDPKKDITDDQRLLASLHYACAVTARYAQDGGIYIPQLDSELAPLEQEVSAIPVEKGGPAEFSFVGYRFAKSQSNSLFRLYMSGPRAAKELLSRIGYNIAKGTPISEEARLLAAGALYGSLPAPTPREGRPNNAHRDTLLAVLAAKISEAAGYTLGGNLADFVRSGPVPVCSCTIAAAAFRAYQVHVDGIRARRIREASAPLIAKVRDVEELARPARGSWDIPGDSLESWDKPIALDQKVAVALEYFDLTL